jgi:hypothetical protein
MRPRGVDDTTTHSTAGAAQRRPVGTIKWSALNMTVVLHRCEPTHKQQHLQRRRAVPTVKTLKWQQPCRLHDIVHSLNACPHFAVQAAVQLARVVQERQQTPAVLEVVSLEH